MQLADLLARFTKHELEILYGRRVPKRARRTPQDVALALTERESLAAALSELNLPQMRILEWLGERPNFQSSWQDLVVAVGERISWDLLHEYLSGLRSLA